MFKSVTRKFREGKLVKVRIRSDVSVIQDVKITGDFFVYPEEAIEGLERELRGVSISEVRVAVEVATVGVILVGLTKEDLVGMIEECLE